MNLIPLSPNILVNPDKISCIEQREIQGTYVTYIWIDDRDYVLTIPLKDFYNSLKMSDGEPGQFFAG